MRRNLTFLMARSRGETDAIKDYCASVQDGLRRLGRSVDSIETFWPPEKPARFYEDLSTVDWRGRWCVLHYTALLWSKRGLPLWLVPLLMFLRARGAQVAVRFHDPQGHPGERLHYRARRAAQHVLMRQMTSVAHRTLHNVPLESVPWLPKDASHARYVPVGSNIPPGPGPWTPPSGAAELTVAVFAMGTPSARDHHLDLICDTLERAAPRLSRPLRLLAMGRGMPEVAPSLNERLSRSGVSCEVHGMSSASETAELLQRAQAILFIRGPLSTQRTTVLAGVAAGLPTIGYGGSETRGPILEAGVLIAESAHAEALADQLVQALSSDSLWQDCHERAVRAFREHFSWDRVAARYDELLP